MWFFWALFLLMLLMLADLYRRHRHIRRLFHARHPDLSYVLGLKIVQGEEFFFGNDMKKFSLLTASILISLVGMTPQGATAAIDGLFNVVSTDANVLVVTPTETVGVFKVTFVGPGQAGLIVTADVDLSDGITAVSQQFDFEIFDPSQQADHFDLQILSVEPVALVEPAPVDALPADPMPVDVAPVDAVPVDPAVTDAVV
jgi:hypothetical protein